jgi:hypothetical protein
VALGRYQDFVVTSLGYYLRERHSAIAVIAADRLDAEAASRLLRPETKLWAAFDFPSSDEQALLGAQSGLSTSANFSVLEWQTTERLRVEALLKWAAPVDPGVIKSIDLLRVLGGRAEIGGNVLPQPSASSREPKVDSWSLDANSTVSGETFALFPASGPEPGKWWKLWKWLRPASSNVTYSMTKVHAGDRYLIEFRYANSDLSGEQRVFVSTQDINGRFVDIFPDGAGYLCARSVDWKAGEFTLKVPSNAITLTVWLRALGTGEARFEGVTLRPIADQ